MTLTFDYANPITGIEHQHTLPARYAVCPDCDGHGTHLHPAIREHAYSPEEFYEAFDDDEERAEYFRHGGRYDVTCETCGGDRVVLAVDRDACALTLRGRRLLALYDAVEAERAAYERERAHERRMGY